MKFVFTDKKVTLPDSVHKYAEKKVGKLDRFFKEDATAAITFSVEKERNNKVEITIRSSGTVFRVSESTSDMHASIDAAVTTLERQIRKNKTRLSKRLRQDAPVAEAEEGGVEVREEKEFDVVRTKRVAVKPMSEDEAILQMNLLGHDFFVYRNTDDVVSIVYRRKNGGYGLLETDGTEEE